MNWREDFINKFCDIHKESHSKWTLFKTTETEDVFNYIDDLLKRERAKLHKEIIEAIQSDIIEVGIEEHWRKK